MSQGVSTNFCHGPELTYEQASHWCQNSSGSFVVVPKNATESEALSDYLTLHNIESTWSGVGIKPSLWHNASGTCLQITYSFLHTIYAKMMF